MIVKNEELNLDVCLKNIVNYVDEIVIVDTGSSDNTKSIASQYTDKIYGYKWNDSFSDARNYSIGKATNEYILVLDGDEVVSSIDMEKARYLIEKNPTNIGRILIISEYSRDGRYYRHSERVSRLFPKAMYQYEGIIHEQIKPTSSIDILTYDVPISVIHSGYDGKLEIRKKKTDRNIKLLKKDLKNNPDDPYILYQLGKSYYMQESYMEACDYFGQALYFDLDIRLEYVQDMVESYGYSLINTEQYELALQLLNVYNEFSHSTDFIFMIALVYMNNGMFNEAIDEFLKATKRTSCKMEGANSYLAYYNIGVIYECLGNIDNAKIYYEKSNDHTPSLERLKYL